MSRGCAGWLPPCAAWQGRARSMARTARQVVQLVLRRAWCFRLTGCTAAWPAPPASFRADPPPPPTPHTHTHHHHHHHPPPPPHTPPNVAACSLCRCWRAACVAACAPPPTSPRRRRSAGCACGAPSSTARRSWRVRRAGGAANRQLFVSCVHMLLHLTRGVQLRKISVLWPRLPFNCVPPRRRCSLAGQRRLGGPA